MGELEEVNAEPGLKKKLLISLLLEDFDITRENSRMLDLFHQVGGGLSGPFVAELDEIRKEFSLEMKKKESAVRSRIENRLQEMDITGDGLDSQRGSLGRVERHQGRDRTYFWKTDRRVERETGQSIGQGLIPVRLTKFFPQSHRPRNR